jgi:hypothetical protein
MFNGPESVHCRIKLSSRRDVDSGSINAGTLPLSRYQLLKTLYMELVRQGVG